LSLIPLWLVERVEIYRGNAPLDADQLGIGGAIFFEPRKPKKTELGFGGMLGSYGARSTWLRAGTGDGNTAALVGLRLESATNDYPYVDDRGTRFDSSDDVSRRRTNADVSTWDLWSLSTAKIGKRASVDLILNGIRREQGVPGLALTPTKEARASLSRTIGAASFHLSCSDDDSCSIHATTSAIVAHSQFDDPLSELALSSTRLDMNGKRFEEAIHMKLNLGDYFAISPAIRASKEWLDIVPLGASSQSAQRQTSRAALSAEYHPHQLVYLRSLISSECQSTAISNPGLCDSVQPAGRLGVQVGTVSLSGLMNAGFYHRVPTLGELYGVSSTVRGNSELTIESGKTIDLGLRYAMAAKGDFRGAWLDLFGFVRSADDLVAYRRSSLGYVRPYNVGSARVSGIEASSGVGPLPYLIFDVTATALDPRDTSSSKTVSNDFIPFRSRLIVTPRIQAFTRALTNKGIDFAKVDIRYTYQSSRYADPAGLIVIPHQGSLDLEAEARVLQEHLALRARLADLFDQRRFDVIGYPLPGRSFYASGELQW
jgi:iron complex outermembrane receptor protein